MKRKRGHKKGKSKKLHVADVNEASSNVVSIEDAEEDTDTDMHDNVESEIRMGAETPSAGLDQPDKSTNMNSNGVVPKPVAVYGRVKVKIRTSKPLDHRLTSSDGPSKTLDLQVTSSDAPTQSDTDKSIQQPSIDKQGMLAEKVEDSANSLPQIGLASDNVSRKSGSIKIKSAKGFGPKSISKDIDAPEQPRDRARQQESIVPREASKHNKQELVTALEVIRKIMKMDAAEPFNIPVNPIELGIPDYFDVIDTPMDFGTIRDNLESGTKYMNSEDVYNDVRYIWENCYKYNNKGDYVVDLMKRVKKNFAKYWGAAGLYTGQPKSTNGSEGIRKEEASLSSHGKKSKKGKGFKRHKDGCLCAICVMKRRRKERVAREAQEAREARKQGGQYEFGSPYSSQTADFKQENARVGSPHGEETSSYMETSGDVDGDVELDDTGADRRMQASKVQENGEREEESRVDFHDEGNRSAGTSEQSHRGGRGENESYPTMELKTLDDSGGRVKIDLEKQPTQQNGSRITSHQQLKRELLEQEKKRQRSKLYEDILSLQHPMLLELAGTLFSDSSDVWNGPHSLVRSRKSYCSTSDIQGAVDSFMSISKP